MQITPELIQMHAAKAVEGLLSKKASLDETIAKIASDKELNQFQIQRLIEATNNLANAELRKTAEDQRFVFKLANIDKILSKLDSSAEGSSVKIASLAGGPGFLKEASKEILPVGHARRQQMKKEAIQHLEMIQHHVNMFLRGTDGKVAALEAHQHGNLQKIFGYVKQAVLANDPDMDELIKLASMQDDETRKNLFVVLSKSAELLAPIMGTSPVEAQTRLQKIALTPEELEKTYHHYDDDKNTGEKKLDKSDYSDLKNPTKANQQHGLVIVIDDMKNTDYDRKEILGGAKSYRGANFGIARAIYKLNNTENVSQYELNNLRTIRRESDNVLGCMNSKEPAKTASDREAELSKFAMMLGMGLSAILGEDETGDVLEKIAEGGGFKDILSGGKEWLQGAGQNLGKKLKTVGDRIQSTSSADIKDMKDKTVSGAIKGIKHIPNTVWHELKIPKLLAGAGLLSMGSQFLGDIADVGLRPESPQFFGSSQITREGAVPGGVNPYGTGIGGFEDRMDRM